MYVDGASYTTEVLVFCNNDYTKMYIVLLTVYNPTAFNETDEAIFNHFVESIKIG